MPRLKLTNLNKVSLIAKNDYLQFFRMFLHLMLAKGVEAGYYSRPANELV
jgi:Zn-dependent oligopeptidase